MEGIDVSYAQADQQGEKWVSLIDWKAAAAAGKEYAIIKATQGCTVSDTGAMAHATGAKAAGLKIGYYHFANVNRVPKDEAAHFDAVVKTLPHADIVPALDIEINNDSDQAKQEGLKPLTPAQMQEWIQGYLDAMAGLGYPTVVIYSDAGFLNGNLPASHPFGKIPLWLAQYSDEAAPVLPTGWNEYVMWQYSSAGKFPVPVDLDRCDTLPLVDGSLLLPN